MHVAFSSAFETTQAYLQDHTASVYPSHLHSAGQEDAYKQRCRRVHCKGGNGFLLTSYEGQACSYDWWYPASIRGKEVLPEVPEDVATRVRCQQRGIRHFHFATVNGFFCELFKIVID